jgi:O-antigen/teichoic acid export membrane protein
LNRPTTTPGRTARGALLILSGIAWGVACGLVIQLFLPRALDPAVYARFAVAGSVIYWLEAVGASLIVRSCNQFAASRDEDWRDVVRSGLFVSLVWGGFLGASLVAAAPFVAAALGDAELTPLLRLFAIDPPLLCSMMVIHGVLQGRRRYAERAIVTVIYWSAKVALTIGLVVVGLSATGAILGSVGGSVVGLAVGYRVTGRLPRPGGALLGRMLRFGAVVAIGVILQKLLISVDLWTVKARNPDPEAAGFYAIAMYPASVSLLVAMAVASSAAATLVRAWEGGEREALRGLVHGQYRFVLVLTAPLVIIVLTDGPALFSFLFSPPYASAALAARFIVPGTALVAIGTVAGNALVAAHRNGSVVIAVAGALVLQVLLLLVLGREGDLSRVGVATLVAGAVLAVVQIAQVAQVTGAGPGWGTVFRVAVAGGLTGAAALAWRPEGALVLAKSAAVGGLFLGLLFALGEIRKEEALSLLRRR